MRLDFLSFAPVFLKELRQIWHSKLLFILLFLAIACDLICLFLAYVAGDSFYVKSINVMIQGIITLCSIISSLAILTSSISRWQLERGDPAVDIALTSPIIDTVFETGCLHVEHMIMGGIYYIES